MKPFVLSMLPVEDVILLERVRGVVEEFPDNLDLGKDLVDRPIELSCHILAHAVGNIFGLKVEDGYFLFEKYQHSWLRTTRGHIIDVYPVGIFGGPILVESACRISSPGKNLYQPSLAVWERLVSKPDIQKAIIIASNVALEVSKKMKIQ